MIYCVVPEALAPELYEKLVDYYADDPNVTVIIDRRKSERRQPGANAGGHPLAGKTGTVNDHTDVWFIGYTPTYTTGVWMGNPAKKQNLGNNMTGGVGALPLFNGFMVQFMKDKPKDRFPEPPPMPPEIKRESELRKREELEKLQDARFLARELAGPRRAAPAAAWASRTL